LSGFISVSEERLIVAGLAISEACAELQDLGQAVGFSVDRRNICACAEGQILIPSETGKRGLS
jgi:hypothetical protein